MVPFMAPIPLSLLYCLACVFCCMWCGESATDCAECAEREKCSVPSRGMWMAYGKQYILGGERKDREVEIK